MLGRSHLLTGAAGMLALGAPASGLVGLQLTGPELAAAAVVGAGAAMLPDIDHPSATVARSLGPITEQISHATAKIFGGHRNGTHSFFFAIIVTLFCAWVVSTPEGKWWALGITFFMSSLAIRVLTEARGAVSASLAGIVACTLLAVAPDPHWVPWAVGAGCLLHCAGDILTPEGAAMAWPLSKKRIAIPIIGSTGDGRENAIAAVAGLAAVAMLWTGTFGPAYTGKPGFGGPASAVASPSKTSLEHQRDRLIKENTVLLKRTERLRSKARAAQRRVKTQSEKLRSKNERLRSLTGSAATE